MSSSSHSAWLVTCGSGIHLEECQGTWPVTALPRACRRSHGLRDCYDSQTSRYAHSSSKLLPPFELIFGDITEEVTRHKPWSSKLNQQWPRLVHVELIDGVVFMSLWEIPTSSSTLSTPLPINLETPKVFALATFHILQFHFKDITPFCLKKPPGQQALCIPAILPADFAEPSRTVGPAVHLRLSPRPVTSSGRHCRLTSSPDGGLLPRPWYSSPRMFALW